ncbi:hypothetical protein IMG5_063680 [Ichthyophthirius multifiliis]|uniref:Transmembrane protein n=1 Tax=Ichthyophthirius multifiliis TaxID=5932 RepID=G0QP40_ICHMU|nr:hypothetical protein IMG5_063680 [Ichthyophthirius multifiliis]EGR33027.1 hypothetical protein IMG5_063680 [Ichthyophthirius multifiliis]|eukprot:XP_004037013.1 hypothetical protein IMG5_063680 [Ichthyophthirius multifiliis]
MDFYKIKNVQYNVLKIFNLIYLYQKVIKYQNQIWKQKILIINQILILIQYCFNVGAYIVNTNYMLILKQQKNMYILKIILFFKMIVLIVYLIMQNLNFIHWLWKQIKQIKNCNSKYYQKVMIYWVFSKQKLIMKNVNKIVYNVYNQMNVLNVLMINIYMKKNVMINVLQELILFLEINAKYKYRYKYNVWKMNIKIQMESVFLVNLISVLNVQTKMNVHNVQQIIFYMKNNVLINVLKELLFKTQILVKKKIYVYKINSEIQMEYVFFVPNIAKNVLLKLLVQNVQIIHIQI